MERLIPHLIPRLDDEQRKVLIDVLECLAAALSRQAGLNHAQLVEDLVEEAVSRPRLKPSIQLLLSELHAQQQKQLMSEPQPHLPKH